MVIVRKLKFVSKWWPKCENNRGVAFALFSLRWKFIEINGLKRRTGDKARGNTSFNIFQDLYQISMRTHCMCFWQEPFLNTLKKTKFQTFCFFFLAIVTFQWYVYSKPNIPLCQPKYCFLPFDVGNSALNNVSHNSNSLIWINVFHLHFIQTI